MVKKTDQKKPLTRPGDLAPVTNDARFASVHSDPRFAMPRRKDAKVAIDKRFSRMLKDDDFAQKASVDRYGRKLGKDAGKEEIKRYYRMDDDDDEEEEEEEDEAAAVRYDPARGEGVVSSEESSDESDDDEADEAAEAISREQLEAANNIPTGDVTRRLAAVNLDWDNVGAADLMKALSSFAPSGGKVLCVTVYPSEFGRERMERENVEGPPSEIFKSRDQPAIDSDDDDDDDKEITVKDLVKEDKGQEFDSGRLRNYQLERLRYFYAVIECDAAATAHHIYDQCDGAEYEATANFFDLRFIPDDTSFEHDPPHDVCTHVPQNYKPNDFVTDALQHSKVKLTWDEDDQQRKQASKRAFSQREVEDMDLQAYLASDTDSEGEDADAGAKYRALLSGVSLGGRDKQAGGDMEVTFTAGLSEREKGAPVIQEDEVLETTIEKYARKERERKQRRKEKAHAAKGLDPPPPAKPEEPAAAEEQPAVEEPATTADLGFADPFFADAPSSSAATATAAKKEKKRKDKEAKAALAAQQASKRAELELLMMDDNKAARTDGLHHFDMKQVVKSEKAKKKHKKAKKQSREAEEAMEEGAQHGFEIDVKDPRFAAVYEKHEFAIDPTNPRFTKTSAMKKMMDERRKRTQRRGGEEAEEGGKRKKVKVRDEGKAASEEVKRLVQSIKSKSSKR